MIQRQVYIRQGLRLYALCGINHKYGSLTGCQASGYLIIEIHMSRSVYEIEYVLLSIAGIVHDSDTLSLDGDSTLSLKVHVVENLILHLPAGQCSGLLYDPVGKR